MCRSLRYLLSATPVGFSALALEAAWLRRFAQVEVLELHINTPSQPQPGRAHQGSTIPPCTCKPRSFFTYLHTCTDVTSAPSLLLISYIFKLRTQSTKDEGGVECAVRMGWPPRMVVKCVQNGPAHVCGPACLPGTDAWISCQRLVASGHAACCTAAVAIRTTTAVVTFLGRADPDLGCPQDTLAVEHISRPQD